MKFSDSKWETYFDISKEVLKSIKKLTDESEDDIIYNLMSLLDHKWTQGDINKILYKRKRGFGTFKVINYNGIKVKCTIGYNTSSNIKYGFSENHENVNIYIKMVPATGQWLRMDPLDAKKFIEKKEKQITENLLLGTDQSSVEVPSWNQRRRQQLKKDRIVLSESQSQVSLHSSGLSAHTSSSQASSDLSDPFLDSSTQSESDEDFLFSSAK